ncbi:hypothetical protein N665_0589s0011 [Sinapis alba]|nr:hypothetical protein N665_0589s0011 [Sinapis alba]
MTGSPTNQVGQQPVDLNAVLASLAAVIQRLDQQDAANKATQERLDAIAAACLPPTQADDQDPDTARRRLFQTTMRNQAVDQATNEELLRLQGTIKDMSSKIHQATSFAPEIDRVLEATQKTPFTKKITDIRVRHHDKLRVPSFRGDSDPSDHITSFNIAMGRAYFSAEERDVGYCQLFVKSLAGPALTWFSRLTADSISTFKELSTEFLKHYSMYIRQGASATDLWKISQGQKESLHDFMERFKNLVSKVDVPDKTAVEALRNALWIRSYFRSDLYTNSTISLEDALHRANCFIRMEEDNAAYTAKHNALKAQLTPKSTANHQEPRQHQPNDKKGKVFSATEEPDASPSTSKTDRPWNVWDRTLDGKPLTYDENKFCTYHKAKGHDTKECKQLVEALFSAFKNGAVTPDPPKSKQNRKKGSWTKNRQAGAKKQESAQAVHPDDQDAAAPPRHREDTDTEDERPQVARRINVISETYLPSCATEKECSDLRDHIQHRRPAVDLRDILPRRKKTEPPETKDNRYLRFHLQRKRSMTELRQSPPPDQESESTKGNECSDLRDHLIHLHYVKKSAISGDDLRNKLSIKTDILILDLQMTLSDKRPSVFRRINVIRGGSPLCNDSVKSIKEYQRKATTARRWPTKYEGETSITFLEGDLVDIDQPHNDPLLVELQIGTCEVTRILIDTGSSVDLIFRQTLEKMLIDLNDIKPSSRALTGFNGTSTSLLGTICLNVFVGGVNKLVKFSVIDTKTQYNAILGTPWLHMMKAIPSTYHQCIKFSTKEGTVFTLKGNQRLA